MKRALFIVDVQKDFMPGGTYPVPFGDRIIPIINEIKDKFDLTVASRDWHPVNHKSFTDEIPPHCIQNTEGADFHPDLDLKETTIFTKGEKTIDLSGFVGVNEDGLNLYDFLDKNDVKEVYVVGLPGDFNVKETAKDCSVFFKTFLIVDATRFFDQMTPIVEDMAKDGVMIINSMDLDIFLSDDEIFKYKIFFDMQR